MLLFWGKFQNIIQIMVFVWVVSRRFYTEQHPTEGPNCRFPDSWIIFQMMLVSHTCPTCWRKDILFSRQLSFSTSVLATKADLSILPDLVTAGEVCVTLEGMTTAGVNPQCHPQSNMQDIHIYFSCLVFKVHLCPLKENLLVQSFGVIVILLTSQRLWLALCICTEGLGVKHVWVDDITVTGGDRCWGQMPTPQCVDMRQGERQPRIQRDIEA